MSVVSQLKLYAQFNTGYSFIGELWISMDLVISTPFHIALHLALDDYSGLSSSATD